MAPRDGLAATPATRIALEAYILRAPPKHLDCAEGAHLAPIAFSSVAART